MTEITKGVAEKDRAAVIICISASQIVFEILTVWMVRRARPPPIFAVRPPVDAVRAI